MDEKLVESAVEFLGNPSVQRSTVESKSAFLKSKGLNDAEINEALKNSLSPQPEYTPLSLPRPTIDNLYYYSPPPLPPRSWKDYFIMATATAGVTLGMYQVIARYLIPAILPPSQHKIDQDMEVVASEFKKVDKLLEQLQIEQNEAKALTTTRLGEVEAAVSKVNEFLASYAQDKLRSDDELKLVRLEIDRVTHLIEKSMLCQSEKLKLELLEVRDELKSLKQILKSRAVSLGSETRKIVSASSVPSAADILKRREEAKSSIPEHTTGSNISTDGIHTCQMTNEALENSFSISNPTTVGNITAGGIPVWQMEHKMQEETQKTNENLDTGIDSLVQDNIETVGSSPWRLKT